MSSLIALSNGEYLHLFCFEDALEAVEDLGGQELRDFIEEYMQDNIDEATYEKLEAERLEAEKAQTDQKTSEKQFRDALLMVQDGLETLMDKLNDLRTDRADMKKLVTAIYVGVNETLNEAL